MAAQEEFKGLADTLADPTRGRIYLTLSTLHLKGMTATQLAKDLELNVNTIYYHLRLLREVGLVSDPEVVVRDNYIEKYYRLAPQIRAAMRRDPSALDKAMRDLPLEQRQKITVALCSAAAQLFARAARQIEAMPAEKYEDLWCPPALGTISIGHFKREEYQANLEALRQLILSQPEMQKGEEEEDGGPHVIIMGGLPFIE